MPLGSYITDSLRFRIMHPLVPMVKILGKKLGSLEKFWRKRELKVIRDLTEKSVSFST